MILSKHLFFKTSKQNYFCPQINEFKIQDDFEVFCSDFQALETYAASLTSTAFATSLASTASTALFPQKTSWSWWFDNKWHRNNQYQSFFVEWIIKNQNFLWYMVPFLLEAVEANLCYFFENWLMKLKFFNLRNIPIHSNKI